MALPDSHQEAQHGCAGEDGARAATPSPTCRRLLCSACATCRARPTSGIGRRGVGRWPPAGCGPRADGVSRKRSNGASTRPSGAETWRRHLRWPGALLLPKRPGGVLPGQLFTAVLLAGGYTLPLRPEQAR
jgi:hypothetical protein